MNVLVPRGVAILAVCTVLLGVWTVYADDTDCPYHKLKWEDFKGDPPANSTHDAETTSGIKVSNYTYDTKKGDDNKWHSKLKGAKATSTMDKTQSWVKPGKKTDELLKHEQYHFDISEYWARELQKVLDGLEGIGDTPEAAEANLAEKVQQAYQDILQKHNAMQEKYDEETDHSRNAEKQEEWCKKIGDLLNPPAPNKTVGQASNSGVDYDPITNMLTFRPAFFDIFFDLGVPFTDPVLQGVPIEIVPMQLTGFHMSNVFSDLPQFMPDEQAPWFTVGGGIVRGNLRLVVGHGNSMTGWIEELDVLEDVVPDSPYLQMVAQDRASGAALYCLEVATPIPLRDATGNFTLPAFLPAQVRVGSAMAPPNVSGTLGLEFHVAPQSMMGVLEVYQPGGVVPIEIVSLSLTTVGGFSAALTVAPGAYDLRFGAQHFLTKRLPNVALAWGNNDVGYVPLTNGDAMADNAVGLADLNAVLLAFGGPSPDLDGDGLVSLPDLNIVLVNFGKVGDN
ncbi:MAG: hypothetical protein AMXMBFR61_11430 [Fimbriimonadales bacterium]